MTTSSSNPDGTIAPEELEFLRRRSKGVGLAITAPCSVSAEGKTFEGEWSCASDDMIPSLRSAASTIKRAGAIAVLQLHHGGRLAPAAILGSAPLSPSGVRAEVPGADLPRAMSEEEIEETIKAFGRAAKRAIQAGFDGIEIHGANGYLLQQFFSPHANRRADQWGGSVENRAAFPIAVVEEVQEVVRRNAYRPFSIGYRISPEEIEQPGITIEETLELVEGLVACRLDWLHIVTASYFAGSIRNAHDNRTRTRVIIDKVRNRTLVIGCGSISDPGDALRVLEEGADLVALGRALIMEPEWVEKVAEGYWDEIRYCLPTSSGTPGDLSIPPRMFRALLNRPGWMNLCQEADSIYVPMPGHASRRLLVES